MEGELCFQNWDRALLVWEYFWVFLVWCIHPPKSLIIFIQTLYHCFFTEKLNLHQSNKEEGSKESEGRLFCSMCANWMHFCSQISCFLETAFLFIFRCVFHFLQHTFWQVRNQSFWFNGESICSLAFLCNLQQEYCPVSDHYMYNRHHEWFSFNQLIEFRFWMHSLEKKAHFFWIDIFLE